MFLIMRSKQLHTQERKRGITLVEVLVSFVIFTVVVTGSVGAVLRMIQANRKAQSIKTAVNNLNFALENMARNIRIGTTYHCSEAAAVPAPILGLIQNTRDCPGGGTLLAFESSLGDDSDNTDQIVYRLNDNASGRFIERSLDSGAAGSYIPMTAPEINIDTFRFFVRNTDQTDDDDFIQPTVMISISGSAGTGLTSTEFSVQTTVTQRVLDF